MMPKPIVVYCTSWCGACRTVRRRLEQLQVPFTEIDIDRDPAAAGRVQRLARGYRSVPTLVFGDEERVLVEPGPAALEEALRWAGYPV